VYRRLILAQKSANPPGHDRFLADVRPLLIPGMKTRDARSPLRANPYDLWTELVARETGVVVASPTGARLRATLVLARTVGAALRDEPQSRGLLTR
jgi:hypothetical protein